MDRANWVTGKHVSQYDVRSALLCYVLTDDQRYWREPDLESRLGGLVLMGVSSSELLSSSSDSSDWISSTMERRGPGRGGGACHVNFNPHTTTKVSTCYSNTEKQSAPPAFPFRWSNIGCVRLEIFPNTCLPPLGNNQFESIIWSNQTGRECVQISWLG